MTLCYKLFGKPQTYLEFIDKTKKKGLAEITVRFYQKENLSPNPSLYHVSLRLENKIGNLELSETDVYLNSPALDHFKKKIERVCSLIKKQGLEPKIVSQVETFDGEVETKNSIFTPLKPRLPTLPIIGQDDYLCSR